MCQLRDADQNKLRKKCLKDYKNRCLKLMLYSDYHISRKLLTNIYIEHNDKSRGDPTIWT